jgi:predicted phosphodiesterase
VIVPLCHGIREGFTPIPLAFNPDDSSSSYYFKGISVTVRGGFIKGIQNEKDGDRLVIRSLSPLPFVLVEAKDAPAESFRLIIENINPGYFASRIDKNLHPARTSVSTLEFTMNLGMGESKRIEPAQTEETDGESYIILGDSRDGYETFGTIIEQVNALNPVFVIDNGDLVYSGKPNQYRIFDQMISGISSTVLTTLGNHDIRGNGRETYKRLYGPEYYSFDFKNSHFIFLDSSRGYAENPAIPDEQYSWLERDLQKAQGKQIIVISHVPPQDPRSGVQPNDAQSYSDKVKQEGGFVEQKLEEHSDEVSMDHGFQSKQEAERFESLMTKYKVDTVYLSHIHSYFDFNKNGVRYIISGGAGAELLTLNSYYHYLITKVGPTGTITMVQLPSPTNLLLKRYTAAVSLFAQAMYKENRAAVLLFIAGLVLLLLFLMAILAMKFEHGLSRFLLLIKDTGKYIAKRHRELYKGKV